MELRPGYKQSEVGVIPVEWEVVKMTSIFTFGGGFSASRDELSSDGYCYLHYGDIHKSTKTFIDVQSEYDAIPKLNVDLKRIAGLSLLDDGDVVFVDASEDDEGASRHIVVVNEKGIPYISGLHTIAAKCSRDRLEHAYRRYCFQTVDIKRQFRFYAVGTKVSGISKGNIGKVLLPLPPLAEQRAIAAALGDIDALLAAQGRLIAKQRALKQAAMQQLLTGRTRLPGFAGAWETKRLGDVSVIKTGKKNNEDKCSNGAYPFFVRSQTVERINSFSFDGEAVLVPGEGGIGTIIHYVNGKFDFHQRVYKISNFANDVYGKFVYLSMLLNFGDQATRNSVKATVDSLRLPTFKAFEFQAPRIEEQRAIAAVLSDMDAAIAAREAQHAKTRLLKQAMMQELLTGRIRLV